MSDKIALPKKFDAKDANHNTTRANLNPITCPLTKQTQQKPPKTIKQQTQNTQPTTNHKHHQLKPLTNYRKKSNP